MIRCCITEKYGKEAIAFIYLPTRPCCGDIIMIGNTQYIIKEAVLWKELYNSYNKLEWTLILNCKDCDL